MTRGDLGNLLAALATLALASVLVQAVSAPNRQAPALADPAQRAATASVIDASGVAVPVAAYRRIASTSMSADAVLPDLVPAARIVAITAAHRASHPEAFRTAHAVALAHDAEFEQLLATRPDLLIVSDAVAENGRVARARELGIPVFELGAMRGRASLVPNIRRLGALLAVPARGEAVAAALERRLDALAARIPPAERARALYTSAYGREIYGGTAGSSYHDVLEAAGLIDIAAPAFAEAWPRLRVEDLLRLQPEIIVTSVGGGERLRALPGMDRVAARIVEVDGDLLGHPAALLEAAEAVQAAVYGE